MVTLGMMRNNKEVVLEHLTIMANHIMVQFDMKTKYILKDGIRNKEVKVCQNSQKLKQYVGHCMG
jgi:hypothetical protein